MRRQISQREAHKLAKRVEELEKQIRVERAAWGREYPGGIGLGDLTIERDTHFAGLLDGVQRCNRVLVVKYERGTLHFYGVK